MNGDMGGQQGKSHARRRIVSFALTSTLLAGLMGWSGTPAALANGVGYLWWNEDGATFKHTTSANTPITIYQGGIDYLCDFIFPTADIYVVRGVPAQGETLVDVSGAPNTVQGASGGLFIEETIGFTVPVGTLAVGTYTIVYDECQDGVLSILDTVFPGALRVDVPSELPPIDPAIAALKLNATSLQASWERIADIFAAIALIEKLKKISTCITVGLAGCAVSAAVAEAMKQYLELIRLATGSADPKKAAKDYVADVASHYRGIAADPPDPGFDLLAVPIEAPLLAPETSEDLDEAVIGVANEGAPEGALAEALLHAIERYQGADAASDGTWGLLQARQIRDLAVELSAQLSRSDVALESLSGAIQATGTGLDDVAGVAGPEFDRIEAEGFSEAQVRDLLNAGFTTVEIAALRASLADETSLTGFSSSAAIADIADHRAAGAAARATLDLLAAEMSARIAALESDAFVQVGLPVADAGGPYLAGEGVGIAFDAGGSSDPDGPLAVINWDLDADGAFDDAAGATPVASFDRAGSHLISLRVTDSEGNVAVDVTRATVADTRHAPAIDVAIPSDERPVAIVGVGLDFSATVTDPDGDAVVTAWTVDGSAAGVGPGFALPPPTAADIGFRQVTVTATDGAAGGGSSQQTWLVQILAADADGDLWRANTDCDDADAAVNPGASEIPLNGKDDDCDPATSDDGLSPTAAFVSTAPAGGRNVALYDTGPFNPTPSADSAVPVGQSAPYDGLHTMIAALDIRTEDTLWAAGPATLRYGVVRLRGSATWLIDRVAVMPRIDFRPQRVRGFAIDVSTTGFASEADWTEVLVTEAADNPDLQTFVLPGGPVPARYVRIRLLSNRGDPSYISVEQFKVYSPQQSGGSTFDFEDRSTDPDSDIVTRTWSFGDGTTSNLADPSHTFPGPGTYAVSLTATDSRGHASTKSLVHRVLTSPTAAFPAPASITEKATTAPIGHTASDPDGERVVRVAWSWGDNTPDSVLTSLTSPSTIQHLYHQDGAYTVRLTVTDAQEQTGFSERPVTVVNVPPTATLANRTVASGVRFNFSASPFDVADPITCTWDFGDGSTVVASCATQAHAYPVLAAGAADTTYVQTFTVTDDDITVTKTAAVTVTATVGNRTVPDGLAFTYNPPPAIVGALGPTTCAWDFGDGSPSVAGCGSQSHAYPVMAPGSPDAQYPLTFRITDSGGTGALRGTVTVKGNPTAPIFSTDFNGTVPSQFSGVTTTEPVQGYVGYGFGGSFLRNADATHSTSLTLTGLPAHTGVDLVFLLAIIDSWDGNLCGAGPDTFRVRIDGTLLFSKVFQNSFCGTQTYVPPVNVELARHLSLGFVPSGSYYADSAYNMGFDPVFQGIPHTGATLTIEWSSTHVGIATAGDESWGIDNLDVFLIGVTGTAPVADAGGPYTANEGTPVQLDGSTSSDPDGDTLEYAWDLDLDGAYDDATGPSPSITPDDGPATLTVRLRVTDPGGASSTDAATISVANVNPTASLSTPATAPEGGIFTVVLGGAADASSADATALEYAFDCGLGAGYGTFSSATSIGCTAGDDDTDAAVRAKIRDDDGGLSEYTVTVSILNAPPSGTFGATSPILEGGSSTLTWSGGTDPSSTDAAALRHSFACDGLLGSLTGSWAAAASSPTTTCDFDDNGSYGVVGRLLDVDNASQTSGAGVTVSNVAPTATLDAPATVAEGSTFGFSLSNATDPSTADALAGFTYAFDCGSGSGYGAFATAATVTCPAAANDGTISVAARIRDKDGGIRPYTATIGVTNVEPTAAAANDGPRPWGVLVTFGATADDPSTTDAANLDITWDLDDDGDFDDAVGPTASRSFAVPGTYPARVRVCDDDVCVVAATDSTITRRTTSLAIGGASSGAYSDPAGVTATLTDAIGDPVAGTSIGVDLGSQSALAVTNGTGQATPVINLTQPAGLKTLTASYGGGTLYVASTASRSYTVGVEAATIAYSGDTFATGMSARLAATVTEAADGSLGDLAHASVTFDVYVGATACGSGSPTRYGPVSVIDSGTSGDGIGTAEYTMPTPGEQTYCIVARLTGGGQLTSNAYYSATPAQVAVLTVVSTTGKFATGGGWIVDPGTGEHGNFGFTARFTKSGTPKGQAVYVWRGMHGGTMADFVVKSNSITGLSFADEQGNGTFPWRATLDGKATIRISRASDGVALVSDGNATFRVVAVDSGKSSGIAADSFAIRVLDKDGNEYRLVGTWTGPTNTGGVPLSGGNVMVHLK